MSEGSLKREVGGAGDGGSDGRGEVRGWVGLLVLAVVFGVLVLPLTALEAGRGDVPAAKGVGYPSEVMDQDWYHWEVIGEMEGAWPWVDVAAYDSATTPGYHWLMAGVLRVTGKRGAVLLVNALIGFGLVGALWFGLAGVVGGWRGAALAAPVMASPYVLGGSIWMTTDNLALMFVVLVLGGCVLRRFTVGRGVRLGVYQLGAVLVRQIHVWPLALIGLSGLLASPMARLVPGWAMGLGGRVPEGERRWSNLVVAGVACGVPVMVLGVFVWLWGGLVPPAGESRIREFHAQGMNPAAFGLALTVVGVYGVFSLGLVWDEVRRVRPGDLGVWGAGLAGLVVGGAFETSYERLGRANGWVWSVVERVDGMMAGVSSGLAGLERSPVIIGGSVVGAVVLLLLYRGARAAGRGASAAMLLLALFGWLCAQSVNSMAWQRYFDPVVLIGLGMLGVMCVRRETVRWAWAGPLGLALVQVALAGATMYREFLGKVM